MFKDIKEKSYKWHDYFLLGVLAFWGLGLELFLISIESLILNGTINYTLHWILTTIVWGIVAFVLVKYSKNSKSFDVFIYKKRPNLKNLLISLGILFTIIISSNVLFWRGFKPFIEFRNLGFVKFVFQYIYYLFEIMLVTLIIVFGQKAGELLFRSTITPWGGILLGFTWGLTHTFTQGYITGIVLFVVSIIFGSIYILLQKNIFYTFVFLFLMFVL